MDAVKSLNYHPVPAARSKPNGMQKVFSKIINKIEDLPPKLHTKLQTKPKACSLVRSLPVTKPAAAQRRKNANEGSILSDDDEFYSKLTFDDSEQSLEDEIFEELEKVAHDEAKLNAALQNFDRILLEYNDKKAKEQKAGEPKRDERPSAIPKPLQKSKTCSIIESKCILKKQDEKKKAVPSKVQKPLNADTFGSITSANYYQVTKSLWNLQDFDEFAKSAQKTKLAARKSEGAVPNPISRAKSAWDMSQSAAAVTPRPTYSRQSSISKIPIKSSKLSTSMLQLNATNGNSYVSPPMKLSKSSAFASTLALTSQTPPKAPVRRTSLCSSAKKAESTSPKFISKYAETKASIQRRNMIASTNSLHKTIAPGKSIAPSFNSPPLKSSKSEMSIHGRFTAKAADRQPAKQKHGIVDTTHQNHRVVPSKVKRDVDSLLDKCLVKGQELLRKAEEFNDANRVEDRARNAIGKRDYIAASTKAVSTTVTAHTKPGSTNADFIKNHRKDLTNETLNVNAITNHCDVDNQTGSHQLQQIESENAPLELVSKSTDLRTSVEVPTLESCEIIIPVVLDAKLAGDKVDGDTKDYSSDCSDDSGHISNENEDLTVKMDDAKKPRKISDELLEIFEKKAPQKAISPLKAKVIELNHVNLIKTSLEIIPTPGAKTCKSEVTFFINSY